MLFLNKKQKFLSNDTFTLTANATNGILTNEVNVDFTPEGKYLTAGNDVVDLSKWNGSGSVNIGDAFSNDNDKVTVMAKDLAAGANLKLTSIENLEIINANESRALNLVGENFKGLESIELKGDATTLNVSNFTYGVKIDATENADNIFGGTKADTINGGAGNDIITGNGGNDVLTGGNGADTFIIGNAKDFGVDQILDFSSEDKISLDGFFARELKKFDASTFSTVTYKTLDSVLATFGQDGANETKAGDVVIFSYDGKTYALLAKGAFTEAGSALVDITGANVASLTESNFAAYIPAPTPTPTPTPPATTYATYAEFVRAVEFNQIPAGEKVGISTLTGAEAGLLAVNKTYLDKIAAGGIENVTGKIVVTVGEAGVSNNFDSNAFAIKLADSVVKSDIVMDITGSGTADNVIITSFVGSINGSGGNDIIDASAATGAVTIEGGSGNDVITGGAGNDSITGGEGKDNITGGSGNDTIVLTETTSASDTIIFAATNNGVDTITGFKAGQTSNGGDVLNVAAFLGKPAAFDQNASGSASSADTTTVASGKNVVVLQENAAKDNDKIVFTDAGKYVVIVYASTSSGNVYYFEATAGQEVVGSDFADTFTKVATVGTTVADLVAGNFA